MSESKCPFLSAGKNGHGHTVAHLQSAPVDPSKVPKWVNNTAKKDEGTTELPIAGTRIGGVQGSGPTTNDWWPKRLRVELLSHPSPSANPYGPDFDYAEEFKKINYEELKADLHKWMTSSQSWWPADYGHYGPQVIRTSWHQAGTYRISDGRGGAGEGNQRFLPINSWLDNGNTDKTRRLLWPIKQKYGDSLSWADLLVLAGNIALESMGVKIVGFSGGRLDQWENDVDTYWGPEVEHLARNLRWKGEPPAKDADLEAPLGDSEAALIYVNPEGPGGNPDPTASAKEIRETFGRMAMNDQETVALIAGGHSFGKSHGAVSPDSMGPPPAEAGLEYQGLGWINKEGTGNANYTITNGIEGSWVQEPIKWSKRYIENLLDLEWELTKSPAGANQWRPKNPSDKYSTPDAHDPSKRHTLMMMTSDMALKNDPEYRKVLQRYYESPAEVFYGEFAEAWYKLTHRDMGPKTRYVGSDVPKKDYIWQDPIPALDHPVIDESDAKKLKSAILSSNVKPAAFARAAWGAASTFRRSDYRGGANGARIRLAPQKDWDVNNPTELAQVLEVLESVQSKFNSEQSKKKVSIADLLVLAGGAAVESAAKKGGVDITVPFVPGRTDTTDEKTDAESFNWLYPIFDGFRNFEYGKFKVPPEAFLLDRAQLLGLSAPQLVALIGGFRAIGLNWDDSDLGVFTKTKGTLNNEFFINLLDMSTAWSPIDEEKTRFEGRARETGEVRWYGSRVDLVLGHEPQLRAVAEAYAGSNSNERFVRDFVSAWNHVMMLDRFDLKKNNSARSDSTSAHSLGANL